MTEIKRRGILAGAVAAVVALVVLGTLVLPRRNRELSRRTEPFSRKELTAAPAGEAEGFDSSVEAEDASGKAAVTEEVRPPEIPPELPEELAPLLDEEADLRARLGIVKQLGDEPGPETVKALFALLDHPPVHETVRNEVCNRLERSETPGVPARLVAHLDGMIRDARHTPLWRDYCAQHLRECYVRHQVPEALDSLRWAAGDAEEPRLKRIGLYSLGLLAREMKWTEGGEDKPETAGKVIEEVDALVRTALDPASHVDARTNAVRAAYVADRREFIPYIRKLLADEKEHVQLRKACASVLGQFRDPGSIPVLEAAAKYPCAGPATSGGPERHIRP